MRIYVDVCCLNRPFDDQTQERIRSETAAVKAVLDAVSVGQHRWVTSTAVEFEISRCQDAVRRSVLQVLLELGAETVSLNARALELAETIAETGLRGIDAIHLALAEEAGCDVFLTTDDDLLHKGQILARPLRIRVLNPIEWVREVLER